MALFLQSIQNFYTTNNPELENNTWYSGPGSLLPTSVRQPGGLKTLTCNSGWVGNPQEYTGLSPYALYPQCYKVTWSGLSGAYTALSYILESGSAHMIGYPQVLGGYPIGGGGEGWWLSTFSPPWFTNQTNPAPAGGILGIGYCGDTSLSVYPLWPIITVTNGGSGWLVPGTTGWWQTDDGLMTVGNLINSSGYVSSMTATIGISGFSNSPSGAYQVGQTITFSGTGGVAGKITSLVGMAALTLGTGTGVPIIADYYDYWMAYYTNTQPQITDLVSETFNYVYSFSAPSSLGYNSACTSSTAVLVQSGG